MQKYLKKFSKSPAKEKSKKESYDWSKNPPIDESYLPKGNSNRYTRPIQKSGTVSFFLISKIGLYMANRSLSEIWIISYQSAFHTAGLMIFLYVVASQ